MQRLQAEIVGGTLSEGEEGRRVGVSGLESESEVEGCERDVKELFSGSGEPRVARGGGRLNVRDGRLKIRKGRGMSEGVEAGVAVVVGKRR